MEREELIEFLKDNLKLNAYCSSTGHFTVELIIEGDIIANAECYLPDRPYYE